MFTEVIPVYSENETKAINMIFDRNAELVKFKADSIVYVLIRVLSEDTSILQKS
jgi:hypothetical protein